MDGVYLLMCLCAYVLLKTIHKTAAREWTRMHHVLLLINLRLFLSLQVSFSTLPNVG